MESVSKNNNIELYSTHNERKYVIAEKCIRNSKDRFFKYMTSGSKNLHIDKLDDIVNKCSNTYHRTIKRYSK